MNKNWTLIVGLLSVVWAVQPAQAVWLAVPEESGATVAVERLQAVVLAGDGLEGIILQPKIKITGEADKVRLVVAVLPVPAPATEVRRAERGSIAPLETFTAPIFRGAPIKPVTSQPVGYNWSAPHVEWGFWFFTPLVTRGQAAVDELKTELAKLKIAPPDDAKLEEYAKNNWSFVICRYEVARDEKLPSDAELPPILAVFPAKEATLPLRMLGSAESLRVYLFSNHQVQVDGLPKAGLMVTELDEALKPSWSTQPVPARQDNRQTTYRLLPDASRTAFDELGKRSPVLAALKNETLWLYRIYADPFAGEKMTAEAVLPR